MPNSKEIIRRIKSTKNIAKITKAMELVSAAKMRRAQAQATSSRPYARLSAELLQDMMTRAGHDNPLINRVIPDGVTASNRILMILITSNKGLTGSLNTNITNKAVELLRQEGAERFDFITIGKKGADTVRRLNHQVIAAFESKDKNLSILDARPIAEIAVKDFLEFKYEKVFLVYSDFVSTLVQKPNITQLLPFVSKELATKEDYLIEPDADSVLDDLIGRTIDFVVYQALVESVASEHSARMVAMRNANDAAGELIDDLTLSYNQARQANITRELAEISAAKLAMEG